MALLKKLEDARRAINERFPSTLISVDTLEGLSSLELPESSNDFNTFKYLTGWPMAKGTSLSISGQGKTSFAWQLIRKTMTEFKEVVAYVDGAGSFFPPGASLSGIDLRFLFWMDTENAACSVRAAELLIESNLFGLVVLDPSRGQSSATSCRRLHLKLLHSRSRLVVVDNGDNSFSIPVHRKLYLKKSKPLWDGNERNCGISSFKGLGEPLLAGGKRHLPLRPFRSGGE